MSVEGPGGLKRVQKVCRGSRVFRELRGSVEGPGGLLRIDLLALQFHLEIDSVLYCP